MKNTITIAFIAFILVQVSFNQGLSCSDGQYVAGANSKCTVCPLKWTTCTTASAGKYLSKLSGHADLSGTDTLYCTSTYYNKNTNNCQVYCKQGCATCEVDYDYCTNCENGYVWNNDFTCIPAVIGLQAASLAFLVIGLVFSLIGCCTVIRAKKN